MADTIIVATPSGGQGKTLISQILGAFSEHQLISVDKASYGKSKLGRMARNVREFDLVAHNVDNPGDSDFFIQLVSLFLSRPSVVDFGANLCDDLINYLRDSFINMNDAAVSNLIFVVPMTTDTQSQRAASEIIEKIGSLPFMSNIRIVAVLNEVRGSFEMDLDIAAHDLVSKVVTLPLCSSSFLRHFEERSIGIERGFYMLKNSDGNIQLREITRKMSRIAMKKSTLDYFHFLERSQISLVSQIILK